MYTLTIDDRGADISTVHDTAEFARAALHAYLELADCNYRPAQLARAYSAYELVTHAAESEDPRVVGVATIEPYTELEARRDLRTVLRATATPTSQVA